MFLYWQSRHVIVHNGTNLHISRLALENFRNIASLDLQMKPGRLVLCGGNGQGKTNLLEAVSMFATARSLRAGHEREVIRWETESDEIPFASVKGAFSRKAGPLQAEIVVQLAKIPSDDGAILQKRVRINGVPRRPTDLVGEVNTVLFTPQDVDLVHGSPSVRRRYLNITLSQADRDLLRQLQRYARVLEHRNSLLRAIKERRSTAHELPFWDAELLETGAFVAGRRITAMAELAMLARAIHHELSGGIEDLELRYHPSIPIAEEGHSLREAFETALKGSRDRELQQGATIIGPHRDDFSFLCNSRELGVYGSRGQQRTAALSLKLAEARYLADKAFDPPVLLLDDVFSELDSFRKGYLLEWIGGWEQAILTTAEPERLDARLRSEARMLEVAQGRVTASQSEPGPAPA